VVRVLLDTNVVSELRKGRRCHEAVAAGSRGSTFTLCF